MLFVYTKLTLDTRSMSMYICGQHYHQTMTKQLHNLDFHFKFNIADHRLSVENHFQLPRPQYQKNNPEMFRWDRTLAAKCIRLRRRRNGHFDVPESVTERRRIPRD